MAISCLSKTSSTVVLPIIPDISTTFYRQFQIIRVQTQFFESWFFRITIFCFIQHTFSTSKGMLRQFPHTHHSGRGPCLCRGMGWGGGVIASLASAARLCTSAMSSSSLSLSRSSSIMSKESMQSRLPIPCLTLLIHSFFMVKSQVC